MAKYEKASGVQVLPNLERVRALGEANGAVIRHVELPDEDAGRPSRQLSAVSGPNTGAPADSLREFQRFG